MTSIDTSTSPTGPLADGAADAVNNEAPLTASATKSSAGTASNTSATGSALSSIEDLVSGTQKQIVAAATSSDGLNPIVKILESVITLVGLLASLTKTFLNSQNKTTSSKPESSETSANATTTKPSGDTSSQRSDAAEKKGDSSTKEATATPKQSFFEVAQSDAGVLTVRSLDGYIVRAEGRDEAWSITGPEGKTTRIWGDPHVTESDKDTWDFKERGTFVFGNNKATLEVVPAANGQTLSSRLTLYCGDERITISGIDKNKPVISAVSHDGKQHDDSLADGTSYVRTISKTGEGWKVKTGNKTKQMGH